MTDHNDLESEVPQPSRTRWRFILAAGVLFSAFAWQVAIPAYQRHKAIRRIERSGGRIITTPSSPQWLRRWGIGLDRVTQVTPWKVAFTDADLKHLKSLTRLEVLNLYGTQVTDAGLEHLKGLTNLQTLWLGGTQVTDAGLEHLEGLTNLQTLGLYNTPVTDAGMTMLNTKLPHCRIERN